MAKLKHLMTYRADLKDATQIGAGPVGARTIVDVQGGSFEGPKLKGRLLESGADWFVVGPDGIGRLDVRATLETEDGAHIYMQYHGVMVINDKVMASLAGEGEYEYGDSYFMTAPRFETGDERYAWLNALVAVAEGRILQNAVEYRVYAVIPE